MNFENLKVLVTDGGARQTLTIIRGLKEIGCNVTVLCSSKLDVCSASRLPDKKIYDNRASGSGKGFEQFLFEVIKNDNYDVLIPVSEMSTNKITSREDEYKKYVKLACAPRSAYIQAFNKQKTFDQAIAIGISSPYTRHKEEDIQEFLSKATFPIIIKPRQGWGSIGFHKLETAEELLKLVDSGKIDPDEYVIQEFVGFKKRFSTHMFIDKKGDIAASLAVEVLRWYPLDAGTAVLIRTIDNEDVVKFSGDILKKIGWSGFANVSFMVDENTGIPKLLEINGRIPASLKMSWLCGFNTAKQLIELAYDEDVTMYPTNRKIGIVTRHSQSDLLWFVKSPDRFHSDPSWFSWKNTKDIVFAIDDPLPSITYTIQRLFRYNEIMKKRRRDI